VSGLAWDEDGGLPLLRWRAAPAGVTVAFTSRDGGVSSGAFRSLNLGALTADEPANVAENRRRVVAAAGGDGAAATMAWQVHGPDVREVDERPAPGRFLEPGAEAFPKSDGLVTGLAGKPLVLLTADCIPVAVARDDGRRVAILHAGWRGLVAGIVERGVDAVRGRARAAIGPGAGPCCYEVGEDVAGILQGRFGEDIVRHGRADLWLAARRALEGAGVTDVEVAGECSICGERFFSHRRDRGTTGRQGVVGMLGA
jgi:YfiH family protein